MQIIAYLKGAGSCAPFDMDMVVNMFILSGVHKLAQLSS